jgi:ubiquinol-cytochrome c reductase iron-sulfur subunit
MADTTNNDSSGHDSGTRRDFLYLATGAVAVVGLGAAAWPFINSMNPAADTLALATIEVDTSQIETGQAITVTWRGKPVFLRRRTAEEIEAARAVNLDELPDPQPDADRVIEEDLLVVVGICTHLGCVPLGQKPSEQRGDFGGYFCPCHGSHYDTSGRIRRGPAPRNLDVPTYSFIEEQRIQLG